VYGVGKDIEDHVAKYELAWRAFDPTYNSFAQEAHKDTIARLRAIEHQLKLETPELELTGALHLQQTFGLPAQIWRGPFGVSVATPKSAEVSRSILLSGPTLRRDSRWTWNR